MKKNGLSNNYEYLVTDISKILSLISYLQQTKIDFLQTKALHAKRHFKTFRKNVDHFL